MNVVKLPGVGQKTGDAQIAINHPVFCAGLAFWLELDPGEYLSACQRAVSGDHYGSFPRTRISLDHVENYLWVALQAIRSPALSENWELPQEERTQEWAKARFELIRKALLTRSDLIIDSGGAFHTDSFGIDAEVIAWAAHVAGCPAPKPSA